MPRNVRAADVLVRTLEAAQIPHVFTLSGNQIMSVFDACVESALNLVHVRHEAAAIHAADAWGRLTGQPGIALVTAGPGLANTLSALYVALMAESPLVLISGESPLAQRGRGSFQEMPQAELTGPVVKAAWTVSDASQIAGEVVRAIRTAISGRPGPVHLAIPVDVLEAVVEGAARAVPQADDFFPMMGLLDVAVAEQALEHLRAADRPLILVGPAGMRGAGGELMCELQESSGIPVVGMESPRGINDPNLGAFAEVLAQADCIALVGKKLDFTLRFGEHPVINSECRFLQFDSDIHVLEQTSHNLANSDRLILTEVADAWPVLQRLQQTSSPSYHAAETWKQEVGSAIAFRPESWQQPGENGSGGVHPVRVCRAVQDFLAGDSDSVFISDGGEFGQWTQACVSAPHRVINGPSGAIGSAIPFAIAARLAFPDSRIVTMLGDGTFGFHPAEFDTAVRYELPFIAVVGNDACWNAERQIQLRRFGEDRQIGCELRPTAYDKVAEAFGGFGCAVSDEAQLSAALQKAYESNRSACLNVALESLAAPVIRRNV